MMQALPYSTSHKWMRVVAAVRMSLVRGGLDAAHPLVNEVAVIPVPSELSEEEVMCVVVPATGQSSGAFRVSGPEHAAFHRCRAM
jgi:hypothetical protein